MTKRRIWVLSGFIHFQAVHILYKIGKRIKPKHKTPLKEVQRGSIIRSWIASGCNAFAGESGRHWVLLGFIGFYPVEDARLPTHQTG